MKRFAAFLIMCVMLLAACSTAGDSPAIPAEAELTFEDFSGKTIGVEVGSVADTVVENDLSAEVKYYNGIPEAIQDLRYGRIAGFIWDLSAARAFTALDDSGDFIVVEVPKEFFFGPLGAFSADQDIIFRFNEFLAEIEANGIKAEVQQRWLDDTPDLETPMPDIPLTGENGTFRVAISGTEIPFTFVGNNNEYKGYSIELALRFAQREGRDVEFVDMDFSGLIPYTQTGKADLGIANVTITEERLKSILFSESIFDEGLGILALRPAAQRSAELVYSDFIGKRFAVKAGTIYDAMATDDFEASETLLFSDYPSIYEAVQRGMADAGMRGYIAARLSLFDSVYSDLSIISLPGQFDLPMGAISVDQKMIDSFNEFLMHIKSDGTYDDMAGRWIENFDPSVVPEMPVITLTGENGTLVVNTSSDYMPFSFPGDGEILGFDIELAKRFCAYLGKDLELVDMNFSDILPYVISGKSDIAISYVTITEERKESVLFSEPYYTDKSAIIFKTGTSGPAGPVWSDFIGKTFAVKNGSVYDYISREIMMASDVMLFEDYPSIYETVQQGRVDAGMRGYYATRVSLFDANYADLDVIHIPEELHNNPIGAISMDQGIIDEFNVFLPQLKADGIYDDMVNRWFDTFDPEDDNQVPILPMTGVNGTLTVATSSDYMPFSYLGDNGVNLGFDIELSTRFAQYLGKDVVFVDMPFSGMLPYVISGKADLGVSDITITEERKKSVLFTEPYFIDMSAIIFKKGFSVSESAGGGSASFIDWVKTGIERNLIVDHRWKMIVNGLGVTMLISVMSQIFGTILGCFICFLLLRKNRMADIVGRVYCSLVNGTPVVVLLLITYYIIFGNTSISNILVAIAAFTIVTGASVGQVLKGAIDTVDPVEIEAARSIGFTSFQAFMTVTLPQAVRRALPAYMNGFVELVKATAIVGFIAIQDLTRAGDIIRSRTYDAFFPLILVAVIYLIVTLSCVGVFKRIIKKFSGTI